MRAILASLLLIGCANNDPIVFYGDTSFTSDQRARIQVGADFIGQRYRPIEIVYSDAPHDRRIHNAPDFEPLTLGLQRDSEVFLNTRLATDDLLTLTAAHEFGHYFGCDDTDKPGLMSWSAGPGKPLEWTAGDDEACP